MGTRPGNPLAPASRVSARTSRVSARTAEALVRLGPRTPSSASSLRTALCATLFVFLILLAAGSSYSQDLSALAMAIRTGTTEQKRDALFQIRNLRSEIASRAAIPALADADPIVRATAASSVVFLPKPEAIRSLSSLLADKDPFVRKEAAYALGKVQSPDAAAPLIAILDREKDLEVKAAIAAALGQTGNRIAIESLIAVLKRKPDEDEEFIRRSAARSIGQIAQINRSGRAYVVTPQNFLPEKFKALTGDDLTSRHPEFNAAVATLTAVLRNSKEADDTRREAAYALGSIGSRSATDALRIASNSSDPYLAEIASEALAKIANANPAN
jgi:HEAT repeat protein